MTTNLLSSLLNHFECPALPVAIAQPQAPRIFFSQIWHKPSFSLFLPSIMLGIYLSLESFLRFSSVLQIKILQCCISMISRPWQEPRHHILWIFDQLHFLLMPSQKFCPHRIAKLYWSESWLLTSARLCPTVQALQGRARFFLSIQQRSKYVFITTYSLLRARLAHLQYSP